MVRVRLRTKFLLSMLLISTGLTFASLWFVRRSVQDLQSLGAGVRSQYIELRRLQHQLAGGECGEWLRFCH